MRGVIAPAIGFHVQLPLRANWNGRFLMWGDGGKDGTRLQIQHVQDFHAGAYDSSGRSVYPGHPFGSEAQWMVST